MNVGLFTTKGSARCPYFRGFRKERFDCTLFA